MKLFPAIDLRNGLCVQLFRETRGRSVIFDEDPVRQARIFKEMGFDYLYITDRSGMKDGDFVNGQAVADILKTTGMKVYLSGTFRDEDMIKRWFDAGIDHMVFNTFELSRRPLFEKGVSLFPGQIIVSLDVRNGFVTAEGWGAKLRHRALDLALQVEKYDVAGLIYANFDRDQSRAEFIMEQAIDLAWAVQRPVVLRGGVFSPHDLKDLLKNKGDVIGGLICRRVFYDGRVDPKQALEMVRNEKEEIKNAI